MVDMRRFCAALAVLLCLLPVCRGAKAAPAVAAASAILVDGETGRVLYEKNSHDRHLIASTTKLMTALVAVESGTSPDKKIVVKPEYQAEGSSMYLKAGETLTLRELLYGLLLVSGNDAALAVAGGCAGDVETFVGWMNDKAAELGMADTHFANPNGLDDDAHYSTAADMALLAREVYHSGELMEIVSTKSVTLGTRALTNHNKLLWRYEGCLGMKTGYTDAAGRTLVSCARRGDQSLIAVTLKDPDDWVDHAALFDYGFETYTTYTLARKGTEYRPVRVLGSLVPQVEVEMASTVTYPLTGEERVRAALRLPAQVEAPVKKGAVAGQLTYYLGDEKIGETYLLYAADVPVNEPRLTLFQRIWNALRGGGGRALEALLPIRR